MSKVDRKMLRVYRLAMRNWRKCQCALCRACAAAKKGGRK